MVNRETRIKNDERSNQRRRNARGTKRKREEEEEKKISRGATREKEKKQEAVERRETRAPERAVIGWSGGSGSPGQAPGGCDWRAWVGFRGTDPLVLLLYGVLGRIRSMKEHRGASSNVDWSPAGWTEDRSRRTSNITAHRSSQRHQTVLHRDLFPPRPGGSIAHSTPPTTALLATCSTPIGRTH